MLKALNTPASAPAVAPAERKESSSAVMSPTECTSSDPLFNFKMAASALMASAGEPTEKSVTSFSQLSRRELTEDIALETACDLPVIDVSKRQAAAGFGLVAESSRVQKDLNMNSPNKDSAIVSPSSSNTEEAQDEASPSGKQPSPASKQCSVEDDPPGPPAEEVAEGSGNSMNDKIEAVKSGLTEANAKLVTAAELYLMHDCPVEGKVVLEYEWMDKEHDPIPQLLGMVGLANTMRRLVHLGAADYATEVQTRSLPSPPVSYYP